MDAISLAISRSGGCSLNAHRRWFPAKRALLSVPATRGPSLVWKLQQQRSYLCSLCHNYTVPCHRPPASTRPSPNTFGWFQSMWYHRHYNIDSDIFWILYNFILHTTIRYQKTELLSKAIRGFRRTTARYLWSWITPLRPRWETR